MREAVRGASEDGVRALVNEPADTASQEEFDSHYDLLYNCVDLILDAVRSIDPAVVAEEPHVTWLELIRENSL